MKEEIINSIIMMLAEMDMDIDTEEMASKLYFIMQTFRQKTGRKSGCHGCKYADWDADGATCKLDGLNVWNPAKGCKYRKAQSVTNGDRIRQMSDEQIAEIFTADAFCGKMNGEIATISDCSDRKCIDCVLQWLKKEAEP